MKSYKVVIGYTKVQEFRKGSGEPYVYNVPYAPFSIITSSKEVTQYLLDHLHIDKHELSEEVETEYFDYELN